MSDFRHNSVRRFTAEFSDEASAKLFRERVTKSERDGLTVEFEAAAKDIDAAFKSMNGLKVKSLSESHPDLEDYFMKTIRNDIPKEASR